MPRACEHIGCKTRPYFNYEHETVAKYCSAHKLENMVDIKSKRCIYNNCKKRPVYNYEHDTVAIYCNAHKLENMVNIKSKRCEFENCILLGNKQKWIVYDKKIQTKRMVREIKHITPFYISNADF